MTEFSPGQAVRVREDFPVGHIRTPFYVRGKRGFVVRRFGVFGNPELAAYNQNGPKRTLYEVQFSQHDLWPDYSGPPTDTVAIDLYDHWLEKV